ncbi:hypothetical protein [Arthrobacter crystallopoietes]|uniref:hypothetical protein n=1 Tax=Crystallibacter crystallopoietes TaxID=37928 RepID=UPI0009447ECB|nr:hypothetical protein [Arthrobacter crystallopoietes]AUI50905.1 hypothetical protein AC20117_08845 [Arthrobacter crystallopoietes]
MLIEPVCEIEVPRETVLQVLEDGHGPVNADGTLRRGYFFPVDSSQALELLGCAGLEAVEESGVEDVILDEASDGFLGGASDRLAIRAVRAEQRFLRDQQMRRWDSSCCLCGRSLPEELLIAAHIKPRWACTEVERMDTLNVSMLACLFGCDALYELGYVVVGEDGTIEYGPRRSIHVEEGLRHIVGLQCPAYRDDSRLYFAWHRKHHFNTQGEHR